MNKTNTTLSKKKNKTRVFLIVASSLFGFLILPSLPMIMMSPMMFDSPGSTESTPTIILVLSMVSYPIITVISIAIGWILFVKKKYNLATILAFLPLVSITIGIIAFISLFVFCEGNFDC